MLLDRFVFKIVPVLNLDGVARGYWRSDTEGCNLNRVYKEPSETLHPTIYAAKKRLEYYTDKKNLFMFLDLHAHANKKACFVFGNNTSEEEELVATMLFPKLISMNCINFEFNECSFAPSLDTTPEADGSLRDGSGRSVA